MPATLTPFLMFEGRAEEAMRFYTGLFGDGRIEAIERYGADSPHGPGAEGKVMRASMVLAGQRILCIDSPISHGFGVSWQLAAG